MLTKSISLNIVASALMTGLALVSGFLIIFLFSSRFDPASLKEFFILFAVIGVISSVISPLVLAFVSIQDDAISGSKLLSIRYFYIALNLFFGGVVTFNYFISLIEGFWLWISLYFMGRLLISFVQVELHELYLTALERSLEIGLFASILVLALLARSGGPEDVYNFAFKSFYLTSSGISFFFGLWLLGSEFHFHRLISWVAIFFRMIKNQIFFILSFLGVSLVSSLIIQSDLFVLNWFGFDSAVIEFGALQKVMLAAANFFNVLPLVFLSRVRKWWAGGQRGLILKSIKNISELYNYFIVLGFFLCTLLFKTFWDVWLNGDVALNETLLVGGLIYLAVVAFLNVICFAIYSIEGASFILRVSIIEFGIKGAVIFAIGFADQTSLWFVGSIGGAIVSLLLAIGRLNSLLGTEYSMLKVIGTKLVGCLCVIAFVSIFKVHSAALIIGIIVSASFCVLSMLKLGRYGY